ncbi:hypothetical protein BHM03_00023943 [Ensete ventricosum]|nr:hypothetical protein BHM03_00023943 [Ensete ventricosum]
MIQEGCVFEWHNIIAAAAREGFAGEDELQWSSYKILSEQLQQEWLESIEKRKTMPRLLIAEAEKAVQALELAALTNPVAQASLLETRKLIAEATWSIKNIEQWELVRMSGDSELDLGDRLLEWWNPGEAGVLQFGSAADSCEKVRSGAEAFIVGVVDHSYLITLLLLWLTMPSYSSTMLAVLAMRRALARRGCRPYLCQVGCTSTSAPHTSVRPVACVESATSAGQLSEGMITWRPGQHLSYHSSPREGLLEAHDEGAEDEVLCLAAGSRSVDPTEQELGKCDVARVDPTEQELGKCDVARVDPTERELGKCDVVRVDPTEQELRNAM